MATIKGTNKYDGLGGTMGPRGPVHFMALRRFAALRPDYELFFELPRHGPVTLIGKSRDGLIEDAKPYLREHKIGSIEARLSYPGRGDRLIRIETAGTLDKRGSCVAMRF